MKLARCAIAAALALAMGSGSASAGEQHATSKSVPQPTVMSDAQLDQIVGAGGDTMVMVLNNRTKAWEKSGGKSNALWGTSNGEGYGSFGALFFVIDDNPSP